MESSTHGATDTRGFIASVEGYFALALIGLSLFAPSVDHPSNDSVIVGAILIGIAFGLALGGVRFGKGGGRFAAQAALGLLSLLLVAVLAASHARWEQVYWYWRR